MSILNKGGQGSGDNNQPPVTLEQIMAEVNKALDAKIGAKFDDFKKTGLGDAIKSQLDPLNAQMSTINEALGRLVASGNNPPAGGAGNAGGSGDGGGKGQVPPEVNAQLRQLTDTVKQQGGLIQQLQAERDAANKKAEETDRHSTIRTALNGLPFVNDKAAETAFSIVSPHVRRLDDGALVAGINGDNFPVDAFVKDFLQKEHAYLFKTSGATGSGAPASGTGVRMGTKADLNQIKVGMKQEDRQAVVDSIAAALQTQ